MSAGDATLAVCFSGTKMARLGRICVMSVRRALALWFLVLTINAPPHKGAAAAVHQIPGFSEAINEVVVLVNKPPPPSREDEIRVAELTCKALTNLVNDPEFVQAMSRVSADTRRIRLSGVANLVGDAAEFSHAVLTKESDALKEQGLDSESTKQVLGEMERMRLVLAQHPEKLSPPLLSPQRIVVRVASVAQIACDLESRLRKGEDVANRPWLPQLWRWLAGGAILAADVLGAIPSEGISALSEEFGRLLVEGA
jgi:hypothetical protein